MFSFRYCLFLIFITAGSSICHAVSPRGAGFFMPDSLSQVTFRYRRADNLIIVPVTINDRVKLNLILDTGCRNLVLFGKRFTKEFDIHPDKRVEFSGLGSGGKLSGRISLGNKVAIDAVVGENIPIVVVPNPNLFGAHLGVDGVIGYDIFIKFEVEVHPQQQMITFRPAQTATLDEGFNLIPIRIEDSRPLVRSAVSIDGKNQAMDIMIDTGSSLGLLLKSDHPQVDHEDAETVVLGRGLNGPIQGVRVMTSGVTLDGVGLAPLSAGHVSGAWSGTSSIGMDVLNQYSFVLNYCKGYAGLKSAALPVVRHTRNMRTPVSLRTSEKRRDDAF